MRIQSLLKWSEASKKTQVQTIEFNAIENEESIQTSKQRPFELKYALTISESRSASGNEIRRPPYLKRIWPFDASSKIKTPNPALRMVDLRIAQEAKQWSSLFLNFLDSLIGNWARRYWCPSGDQSNATGAKRGLWAYISSWFKFVFISGQASEKDAAEWKKKKSWEQIWTMRWRNILYLVTGVILPDPAVAESVPRIHDEQWARKCDSKI